VKDSGWRVRAGLPDLIRIAPLLTTPSARDSAVPDYQPCSSCTGRRETILKTLWAKTHKSWSVISDSTYYARADPRELSINRCVFDKAEPFARSTCSTAELFVGSAGTAARFLTALVCLSQGVVVCGACRVCRRPQAALLQALRALGYRIQADSDRLPVMHSAGPVRRVPVRHRSE
jgi:3-phosphoshikimate 1-carboxyvinyltransferase